jgi:putative transcriptional regulator
MENRIADPRAKAGISQAARVEQVCVSRQTIISIERGRFDPSLPLALRLAKTFDLSIEDLFTYTKNRNLKTSVLRRNRLGYSPGVPSSRAVAVQSGLCRLAIRGLEVMKSIQLASRRVPASSRLCTTALRTVPGHLTKSHRLDPNEVLAAVSKSP